MKKLLIIFTIPIVTVILGYGILNFHCNKRLNEISKYFNNCPTYHCALERLVEYFELKHGICSKILK